MGGGAGAQVSVPGHVRGRELVARYLNIYREQAKQYGYEASPDQVGWASPVYVADTDERAREEAKEGIETLFNDFLAVPFQMLLPPATCRCRR